MTRPKQARAAPAAVATDTAATAIMAQLKAYQEEVAAPVNPFAGAAKVNPFAGSANPFASVRNAASAFATKSTNAFAAVASKATEAFGPKGSTALRSRALDAFRPQKGRGVLPPRRFLVPPPPPGPPRYGGFWLPMCELLNLYEETDRYIDKLWSRGDGWDFDFAAETMSFSCVEEGRYYNGCDHEPNDEGYCSNPEHVLLAMSAKDLEDTFTSCCCDGWEWEQEWQEIVPLMQEIREEALANPDVYLEVPQWLEAIYKWAGWSMNDLMEVMRTGMKAPIMEAVETGVHDEGLAAAYADCMARHFPLAFGALGKAVDDLLTQIHTEGWLCESPVCNLVFEEFREPREMSEQHGRSWLALRGRYGVSRVTYHSALTRPAVDNGGRVGWRSLWMVPVESWSEILEQDGAVVWDIDDDDAESNKGY